MDEETRERCIAWAEERFAEESETHRWIRREMEARDFPLIQVSPLEGRTLAVLARMAGARRLLEIGTLGGYSGLWLLSLLGPEAELVTVERVPEHAALAREAFRRAGVEDRVRLVEGDAREAVPALREEVEAGGGDGVGGGGGDGDGGGDGEGDGGADGEDARFDLAFLDADKESYPLYLEASAGLLRPGGLLLADNAFWHGRLVDPEDREASTEGIRELQERVAADPRFEGTVLPVRDGLLVARFRR